MKNRLTLIIFIMFALLSFKAFGLDDDSDSIVTETCVCTPVDNCPNIYNPDQSDCDSDGIGDICDETPGCDTGVDTVDTGIDTESDTDTASDIGTDTGTVEVWDPSPIESSLCEEIPGVNVFWQMDTNVLTNIQSIYEYGQSIGNQSDVFAICGDSHSATPADTLYRTSYFMGQCSSYYNYADTTCFPSLDNFMSYVNSGDAGGVSSFLRYSVAAVGGKSSSWLVNDPSPILTEAMTISPAYVTIMFGTNDAAQIVEGDTEAIATVSDNIIEIADTWAGLGVVPIIISPPVRVDKIEVMIAISNDLREAANIAHYPFVDFHSVSSSLPDYGLRSSTSYHLATAGWNEQCCFTSDCASGVSYFHLVALQALDRIFKTIE